MIKRVDKYSYQMAECDHEIWFVVQEYDDETQSSYKYECRCLQCGKVIREDRWEMPLPLYYVKGEVQLANGASIYIPYEQVKSHMERIIAKYQTMLGRKPDMLILHKLLAKYYGG